MGKKLLTAISFVSAALLLSSCGPSGPSELDHTVLDTRACEDWDTVLQNPNVDAWYDSRADLRKLKNINGFLLEPIEGSVAHAIRGYAYDLLEAPYAQGETLLDYTSSGVFRAKLYSVHVDIIMKCAMVGFEMDAADSLFTAPFPEPTPEVVTEATDEGACLENMRIASTISNNDDAERYLKLTAETCGGAAEWYAALREYPGAMGYYDVQGTELNTVCFVYPNTRACNNP